MIIKGKSRGNPAQAGAYLLNKGENQRVELVDIKGCISDNVADVMREWAAIAEGSKAEKPFYHASINPEKGVYLTPEQWEKAVDLLAKNLGLENCARVVVEHDKDGRVHQHILFNRIDPDTGNAVKMSHNYRAHELTSFALAKEFGLNRPKGRHVLEEGEKPADRGPTHNEMKEAGKTGVNLYKWREEIRDILANTLETNPNATGQEIAAALEAGGHILAHGDKKKDMHMILDPSGTPHRLAQSLNLKKKGGEFASLFGDIDPADLPSIEEAQKRQREQQDARPIEKEEAAGKAKGRAAAGMYDRESMADQQRDALKHNRDRQEKARQTWQHAQAKATGSEQGRTSAGNGQGTTGKEKSQKEQRTEEKQARTEQTEAQRESQAKTAMREMFERKFGHGHGEEVLEKWQNTRAGRERER